MTLQKLIEKIKCDNKECGKPDTGELHKLCDATKVMMISLDDLYVGVDTTKGYFDKDLKDQVYPSLGTKETSAWAKSVRKRVDEIVGEDA